jgi:hypothetical protein
LEKERAFFEAQKPELLKTQTGQFALIHGEKLLGVYTTRDQAFLAGVEAVGNKPFLVEKIDDGPNTAVAKGCAGFIVSAVALLLFLLSASSMTLTQSRDPGAQLSNGLIFLMLLAVVGFDVALIRGYRRRTAAIFLATAVVLFVAALFVYG